MARYFTLQELLKSDTAKGMGIDNIPTFEVVRHLADLAETLDILRIGWGGAVNVTSGYRSPRLNAAVGGSATSAHMIGWAADLQPADGRQREFNAFVVNHFRKGGIAFDQIIREKDGRKEWLHLALFNAKGEQRGQVKDIVL